MEAINDLYPLNSPDWFSPRALILAGEKERVSKWILERVRDMPCFNTQEYEAIGVLKDGRIIGGVIYTHYSELPDGTHDIQMTCAGEVGWITKTSCRVMFGYPMLQLNCSRVSTIAAKANKKARSMNERLGFVHEGTIRGAFGTKDGQRRDGILYGMLRSECRFIK